MVISWILLHGILDVFDQARHFILKNPWGRGTFICICVYTGNIEGYDRSSIVFDQNDRAIQGGPDTQLEKNVWIKAGKIAQNKISSFELFYDVCLDHHCPGSYRRHYSKTCEPQSGGK